MAKTFKFNVSFALSVGACSEVVTVMRKTREELVKEVEKNGLEATLKKGQDGHRLVKLAVDPKVAEEEFFRALVITGTREFLKEMGTDDKEGNFQRIGDISIKPRDPKVTLSAPECLHCRVLHNAGRPYKCAVCRSYDAAWEAGDI